MTDAESKPEEGNERPEPDWQRIAKLLANMIQLSNAADGLMRSAERNASREDWDEEQRAPYRVILELLRKAKGSGPHMTDEDLKAKTLALADGLVDRDEKIRNEDNRAWSERPNQVEEERQRNARRAEFEREWKPTLVRLLNEYERRDLITAQDRKQLQVWAGPPRMNIDKIRQLAYML